MESVREAKVDAKKKFEEAEAALKKVDNQFDQKNSKLDELRSKLNDAHKNYKVASNEYDSVLGSIERKSAEASRQVQIYRAYLDIVDSGASIAQNITKLNNTVNHDYKAAMAKVDSETAAYMVNFFSSSAQHARTAASQAIDGMNSVRSGCDASIQNADSSVNYAIRAI
jgi:chromosome segregation ATPase